MGGIRSIYVLVALIGVVLALYAGRGGFTAYPEAESIGRGVASFHELSERFEKLA